MDIYDVGLTIREPGQDAITIDTLPVFASKFAENQGFQVLVGLDVIQRCKLRYDGPEGHITISIP